MEHLVSGAQRLLKLTLTPSQVAAFRKYSELLLEWNRKFNLTAITDPHGLQVKHFLDSLTALLALYGPPDMRLVDVGSGAGFPGIPLKIVCPQLRLTLAESSGKKAGFCQHLVEALRLNNVQVIKARAEEVGRQAAHRERYDWAIARAVARMPVLMEYLLPLAKVGGHAIAMKGEEAPGEAQAAGRALELLGGRLQKLIPVELPGVAETRYLVVCDKVAATDMKYPRRPGIPSKDPL